jgi:hypothetical protein
MESISEPWHEDDCEAVEGVMAGPEAASQGNNRLLREILSVVKAVRTAVSDISDIKSKVSEIEKSVEDLLSYSRTIVLCSGKSPTKDAASLEEQIAQQLMPVNSLFSTEYVTAAVCSSLPQFLFKQAKDVSLQTNIEGPQILLAVLIFSSLPNEKKTTNSTEIGRLHSDLKSLIAKVLIVNCATRAPSIAPLSQTSGRRSNSMDFGDSENDTVRSGQSQPILSDVRVRAEWMTSGYVRPEIYEEVRREIDGFNSTAEKGAGRLKRRKLAPESEFKDQVSRALVKAIYQKIHSFFRTGRDQGKRLLFQQIGFITCDETQVKVEIENSSTLSVITDVDQTHPLTAASKSPDDDEKNAVLISNFERDRKEMHITIEYNVSVTVEDKVETKCLVRKISIFNCALNFCIALTQSPNAAKFFRSSPDSLRMVYLVSVAFRNLVVEYEELRQVRRESEFGKKWEELISRWSLLLPGNAVRSRILRDGIISMNYAKYQELNIDSEKDHGAGPSSSDEEDLNKVERDVQDIELRV